MPWCPACDRFLSPPSVRPDGTCPACGRPVDPGRARPPTPPTADPDLGPLPWHFKLLAGGVALYLGYRFYEIAAWLVGHR